MPQDYIYDVFVSYRHKPPMLNWVRNHFEPLLEQWLPNFLPYNHETRIFIDMQIETGAEWPYKLRQARRMSRCLLPVWSPQYFQSNWCQAELQTMLRREQLLGLRTEENSSGLIYAVLFAGAENLPSLVRTIQYKDMSKWNCPWTVFKKNAQYVNLDRQVQKLSQELAKMIQSAPVWQEDWPVVLPQLSSSVAFTLPRLQ